jgi:hypothetical protein
VPDHSLERQEEAALADREEPGQQLGHLHTREALLAGVPVADEDSEAERERRDVRERLTRPHRERGQDGKDVAVETLLELVELLSVAVLDPADNDSCLRQCRAKVPFPELRLGGGQLERSLSDLGERLLRGPPVGGADEQAGFLLSLQAGDPDLEELVEIRREVRAITRPLEQRECRVGRTSENPSVVVEPRQLAVEHSRVVRLESRLGVGHELSCLNLECLWVTDP